MMKHYILAFTMLSTYLLVACGGKDQNEGGESDNTSGAVEDHTAECITPNACNIYAGPEFRVDAFEKDCTDVEGTWTAPATCKESSYVSKCIVKKADTGLTQTTFYAETYPNDAKTDCSTGAYSEISATKLASFHLKPISKVGVGRSLKL